jgi:hypothetical protein
MSDNLKQRLTKEDFCSIFQDHSIGLLIWKHLHTKFVTNKSFDKDPYVHAFNAGQAEVIHYLIRRMTTDVDASRVNPRAEWNLEGDNS